MLRLLCAAALGLLAACSTAAEPGEDDGLQGLRVGQCRMLAPADIGVSTNVSDSVTCTDPHTAETFAVGIFPASLAGDEPDDQVLGAAAYDTCTEAFAEFVGGGESLVMRSVLTWAWFRPSAQAWADGARWYRCDVVGGGQDSDELVELPETAEGLLEGRPDDRWLTCADGRTVAEATRVPCTEPHTWRAVTTIVLGKEDDDYPGDRRVEVRTREFCSDSVGAWLNYPVDYDYGFTWFHEAEWEAGNRRSVCWAQTDQ